MSQNRVGDDCVYVTNFPETIEPSYETRLFDQAVLALMAAHVAAHTRKIELQYIGLEEIDRNDCIAQARALAKEMMSARK